MTCIVYATACSRLFIVKPIGTYGNAIAFRFYDITGEQPSRHNIVDLYVQEYIGDGKWSSVWMLKGKQSLEEIVYGQRYEGLTEVIPPKVLSLNGAYRVVVSDLPMFEPAGVASAGFAFDTSGNLILKWMEEGHVPER